MLRRHDLDASEDQTVEFAVSRPLDLMNRARIVVVVGLACFALAFIGNRVSMSGAHEVLVALAIFAGLAGYISLLYAKVNPIVAAPVISLVVFCAALLGSIAPYALHLWGQTLADYGSSEQRGFYRLYVELGLVGPIVIVGGVLVGLVTEGLLQVARRVRRPVSRK